MLSRSSCLVCSLLLTATSLAQIDWKEGLNTDIQELIDRAEQQILEAHWKEALEALDSAHVSTAESTEVTESELEIALLKSDVLGKMRDYAGRIQLLEYIESRSVDLPQEGRRIKARALIDMGEAYGDMKEYDLAIHSLMRASDLLGAMEEPVLYATVQMELGWSHSLIGDRQVADNFLASALEQFAIHIPDDEVIISQALHVRGYNAMYSGQLEVGREYLLEALELRRKNFPPDHPNLGYSWVKLGELSFRQGDYAAAITYCDSAYNLAFSNADLASRIHYSLAMDASAVMANSFEYRWSYEAQYQDLLDAFVAYGQAINAIEEQQRQLYSLESQKFQMRRSENSFEGALRVCNQLHKRKDDRGYAVRALEIMELSKNYYLNQKLNLERWAENNSDFREILEEESELRNQLKSIRENLDKGTLDDKDIASVEKTKGQIHLRLYDIQNEIEKRFPEYSEVRFGETLIDVSHYQDIARRDSVVFVEYYHGSYSVFGLSIHPDTLIFSEVRPGQDLSDAIEFLSFQEGTRNAYAMNPDSILPLSQKHGTVLYDQLIQPHLSHTHFKNVVFILDGNLNEIPFEASVLPSGKYLIETHDILYTPSLQFFSSKQDEAKAIDTFSAIANEPAGLALDLPHAWKEVGNLKALYNADVVSGCSIDEADFFQNIQGDIVHLSLHAMVDAEDPTRSSFLICPEDSAYVILDDILRQRVKPELLVLSSCQSGHGKWERGEGPVSLARAFNYSGTRSIVYALWDAEDYSTSLINGHFYKNLFDGSSQTQALTLAKRAYLAESDAYGKFPAFWAHMVLSGGQESAQPTPPRSASSFPWMIVVFIVILLAITLFFRKARKKSGS